MVIVYGVVNNLYEKVIETTIFVILDLVELTEKINHLMIYHFHKT